MVSLQTRLVYNKHNVTVFYSLVIYLFKTTERPANNSTGVWKNFNSFKPALQTYTQRHLHVWYHQVQLNSFSLYDLIKLKI